MSTYGWCRNCGCRTDRNECDEACPCHTKQTLTYTGSFCRACDNKGECEHVHTQRDIKELSDVLIGRSPPVDVIKLDARQLARVIRHLRGLEDDWHNLRGVIGSERMRLDSKDLAWVLEQMKAYEAYR